MAAEFEWDVYKAKDRMENDLRPEYDLKSLRVRKVGPKRTKFGDQFVQLAPDVAEVFPDSAAVNEALRFLIRIMRENRPAHSIAGLGDESAGNMQVGSDLRT